MINFEDARKDQLNEICSKYAIGTIENCKTICDEKGIDVDSIVSSVKPDANEMVRFAMLLGATISIKKDTKLASYVAYDIGEAIQALCLQGTDAYSRRAGEGIGMQASNKIKGVTDQNDLVEYSSSLDFIDLNKEDLLNVIVTLAKAVEEKMK